jgi:haloacetate dehalogenase
MCPGFTRQRMPTSATNLYLRSGGSGPPLLLVHGYVHGYPQTYVTWHKVAPTLAQHCTVVLPDLRGDGDSAAPEPDAQHLASAERAMAQDLVAVMTALGFARFGLAGHDRGGRVAYRRALSGYYWFFLAQPAPWPETLIGGALDFYLCHTLQHWAGKPQAMAPEALAEYLRYFRNPAMIHATCEDYRVGLSGDVAHARANRDAGARIRSPVPAQWGAQQARGSHPVAMWQRWAEEIRGVALDCGHFVMEEAPEETAQALRQCVTAASRACAAGTAPTGPRLSPMAASCPALVCALVRAASRLQEAPDPLQHVRDPWRANARRHLQRRRSIWGDSMAKLRSSVAAPVVKAPRKPRYSPGKGPRWSWAMCWTTRAGRWKLRSRHRAVETAVTTYGKLDVLVNNAGIVIRKGIEETSEAEWDRIMAVNAKGVFLGTKAAIPAMRQAGGGSIINISSTAGLVGSPSAAAAYTATKGAVRLFTKVTAIQHANDHIRCNSVHPGPIETAMLQEAWADPAMRAERLGRIPLGRIGTPDDIAYGVLYLASDESSFVTGAELVIDGGATAQ